MESSACTSGDCDAQRCHFFALLHKQLEAAAQRPQGYQGLTAACIDIHSMFHQKYPIIPYLESIHALQSLPVDQHSKTLLPQEWKHLTPVKCVGDGNCLYRAASIWCCGNQSMYTELRVRTLSEIILNEEFYLQPSIISMLDPDGSVISKNVLPATALRCDRVNMEMATGPTEFAREALHEECLGTVKDGSYSSMWHIHGLASILKRSVVSIYPEFNHRHRSVFNRECHPRNAPDHDNACMKVFIMWTRTPSSYDCIPWSPNHFVPCYHDSTPTLHCSATKQSESVITKPLHSSFTRFTSLSSSISQTGLMLSVPNPKLSVSVPSPNISLAIPKLSTPTVLITAHSPSLSLPPQKQSSPQVLSPRVPLQSSKLSISTEKQPLPEVQSRKLCHSTPKQPHEPSLQQLQSTMLVSPNINVVPLPPPVMQTPDRSPALVTTQMTTSRIFNIFTDTTPQGLKKRKQCTPSASKQSSPPLQSFFFSTPKQAPPADKVCFPARKHPSLPLQSPFLSPLAQEQSAPPVSFPKIPLPAQTQLCASPKLCVSSEKQPPLHVQSTKRYSVQKHPLLPELKSPVQTSPTTDPVLLPSPAISSQQPLSVAPDSSPALVSTQMATSSIFNIFTDTIPQGLKKRKQCTLSASKQSSPPLQSFFFSTPKQATPTVSTDKVSFPARKHPSRPLQSPFLSPLAQEQSAPPVSFLKIPLPAQTQLCASPKLCVSSEKQPPLHVQSYSVQKQPLLPQLQSPVQTSPTTDPVLLPSPVISSQQPLSMAPDSSPALVTTNKTTTVLFNVLVDTPKRRKICTPSSQPCLQEFLSSAESIKDQANPQHISSCEEQPTFPCSIKHQDHEAKDTHMKSVHGSMQMSKVKLRDIFNVTSSIEQGREHKYKHKERDEDVLETIPEIFKRKWQSTVVGQECNQECKPPDYSQITSHPLHVTDKPSSSNEDYCMHTDFEKHLTPSDNSPSDVGEENSLHEYISDSDQYSPIQDEMHLTSSDNSPSDVGEEYSLDEYISDSDQYSPIQDEMQDSPSRNDITEDEERDFCVSTSSAVMTESQVDSSHLPFPQVSAEWYKHQQTLAVKNSAREVSRQAKKIQEDERGAILCVNRSRVQTTLQESIQTLTERAARAKTGSSNHKHLTAVISVGEFLLDRGPVVRTSDAGAVYKEKKGLSAVRNAVELYEVFSKHLNISQIYLFGRAFIVSNTSGSNIESVVESLKSVINREQIVKEVTEAKLADLFAPALQYMDTARDKKVLKALIAELTSVRFAAKLQCIKSRGGTTSAKKTLHSSLKHYQMIRHTSQIVRSDLTNTQQHRLTERIIFKRKMKEIKVIADGRGRKLKSTEFSNLANVLAYAFGEYDIHEGGGGLECHPRLIIGTMYRAVDSCTTMKRAREILLSLAPKGFKISLSSCYNYTENYRRGSVQAKQHHQGKGVNAPISLRRPPRTGVNQLVVNLHWTTANVNLIVDSSHNMEHCMVVSKDAKAIIPADIEPVQRPGHSWSSRMEFPDHTWDQSRTNAVTPMTFLFLQTVVSPCSNIDSVSLSLSSMTTLNLTRTGQAVTLLNISFFEPETTFKCLNEVLFLLTLPALDDFFRDRKTGKLKLEWTFVVDNGPAEQPSSPLVQLCLARLLNLLKLHRITQVSFAEYHSKRNYVERVHAEENRVLSKHGPFSSKLVHQLVSTGSKEHKANMERMVDEVRQCIGLGTFGSRPLLSYRGIKPCDYLFTDEEQLHTFLSLNEEGKLHFSPSKYTPRSGDMFDWLHFQWGVNADFEGDYLKDYQIIQNESNDLARTAWTDKYTTSLYAANEDVDCRRYELQPMPDYLRWYKTCELHYLPLEERVLLSGPWDDIPAVFLPSKVLELCFAIVQNPSDSIVMQISLLSWTTPKEVREYYKKNEIDVEKQVKMELEKERWKSHNLYKAKTKLQLETQCRSLKIPATAALHKHELVSLICEKTGQPQPPEPEPLYSGSLSSLPSTATGLQRLTIPKLKNILRFHKIPPFGGKDELILKVLLLRQGRSAATTTREEAQLKDLIKIAYQVIFKQRYLNLASHVYRQRKYHLKTVSPHFVPPPPHVKDESDMRYLFQPLLTLLDQIRKERESMDECTPLLLTKKNDDTALSNDALAEKIKQTGAKIKVKWTSQEVGDSGWRPGWYTATVHGYCHETDTITAVYVSEPDNTYDEELSSLITQNRIKLMSSPL